MSEDKIKRYVCSQCLTQYSDKKILDEHAKRCKSCIILMITQLMSDLELLKSSHIHMAREISNIQEQLEIKKIDPLRIEEVITTRLTSEPSYSGKVEDEVKCTIKPSIPDRKLNISIKDKKLIDSEGKDIDIPSFIEAIIKKDFTKFLS